MNDLQTLFKGVVADPPPPSEIPSQAVFARIRKVRRRRAAGGAVLATAAVAAVVAIAGNLNSTNSQPPVLAPPPVVQLPVGAVSIEMVPTVVGKVGKMAVTMRGTVRVPLSGGDYLPTDNSFIDMSTGFTATWGQGEPDGGDGGAISCEGSTKETTGAVTYHLDPHAYPKPGTYTVKFAVKFCGPTGDVTSTKSVQLVIK
ncbi:hypothetical protein E1263_39275 [Kribbella antibiotica]|uniref:Uncharacterized protein n=1 Tax=Kribbella antibiotica TaxID=190195 RepID=A0A4R4YJN3_9ACTN|nr:hypothetical protein [Kribbella antibiotica]TDD45158.1 hypothetical protein E1263_39275 [Kribbella antibiotica]